MRRLSHDTPLLLGSASPRRREILAMLGVPHDVRVTVVDESGRPGESADAYLVRVVEAKRDAARRLPEAASCAAVLVADTSVVVDGEVLGKPENELAARAMVRRLAGRVHEVRTRFSVSAGEEEIAETVRTLVTFRALDEKAIAAYAATGEGTDKAGAYAIQGRGAALVSKIDGSYTNVVGLPACEVVIALETLGLL